VRAAAVEVVTKNPGPLRARPGRGADGTGGARRALVAVVAVLAATLGGCSSARAARSPVAPGGPKSPAVPVAAELVAPGAPAPSQGGPRLPDGWVLDPAGRQVALWAQPDGVALSPDGRSVYVPTSGQWTESLGVVDAATLEATDVLDASAFVGVAADGRGDIFVSAGGRDQILRYRADGPASARPPADFADVIPPLARSSGIPAPGYPGELVLGPDHWLYAAGTLPLPASEIAATDPSAGGCPSAADRLGGGAGASPSACSVVDAIDVANPAATRPVTHLIPVGQDAWGLALGRSGRVLYVSNWADGAVPSRGGGDGTVSVVELAPGGGSGREVEEVPVGPEPMGVALSPDGRTLAVANSRGDSVSLLSLDAAGRVVAVRTVPVGLAPEGVRGSQPVAVAFSPDGRDLFVALFGLDAIEVLHADGAPIPEKLELREPGRPPSALRLPLSLVPTGWMPVAMAVGPRPSGASGERLYVANFQGMGTGPGFYNPASASVGAPAYTEGSLSVVSLPRRLGPVLAGFTAQAVDADRLLPLLDRSLVSPATDPCAAVPLPGGASAFSPLVCEAARGMVDRRALHVVIVLRENKTVDSMLGYLHAALPALDGDVAYDTYGPQVTPNLARLAEQFGIDDENWVAGDESETGHATLTGGETTPYTELFVHVDNDFGLRGSRSGDPLALLDHPRTRLADEVLAAGLSEVTYGGDLNPDSPANRNDIPAAIWGNAPSPVFAGTNTDFPDTDRVSLFLTGETVDQGWDTLAHAPFPAPPPPEYGKVVGLCGGPSGYCGYPGASRTDFAHYSLAAWTAAYRRCRREGRPDEVCQAAMPSLTIIELPDDHTDVFNDGNNPRMWAPQVMVANNDLATGELIEGLSHSPFWRRTLVMVMEDDTQFTGDHVNVLRSYVVTAGGLARRLGPKGEVSDQPSSFCAVDKTVEDLLGVPPMAVCDATAFPLDSLVASSVPTGPLPGYTAVVPGIPPLLPPPRPRSPRLEVWCAKGVPTGIGTRGLLHFQLEECLGSEVGGLAATLKIG
jgi:DNA-binding beta-propeller fold protein YncE